MSFTLSPVVSGVATRIGSGFEALQFTHDRYPSNMMSPMVMIDHFRMSAPTFEPHPHAGMSAVTLVFEDTEGAMMCVDSTGRHSRIGPGDLHWTLAGRGIVHTQQPANADSRIHALQIFVNLPVNQKMCQPSSFHVARSDMPRIRQAGCDVTVVAGEFQGLSSPALLPQEALMLDVHFDASGAVSVPIPVGWNAVVLCVSGDLAVDGRALLQSGQSLAVAPQGGGESLQLVGSAGSRGAVLAGKKMDEPVVQRGPFVMQSNEALADRVAAYQRGDFGVLDLRWLEQETQS